LKRLAPRIASVFLAFVICLSFFGCGPKPQEAEPAPPVSSGTNLAELVTPINPAAKVTVGLKQAVSDSGVLIGVAKGYYKELGIEIEMQQFATGQDMINALAAGQLDVGLTVTASGLFNAMLRDLPLKIVADKGFNIPDQGYYRFVIQKDLVDEVKDFEDLRGRKLGIVGTASLDEIALDRVLQKGGMTTADVDMQVIRSFPDIVAALSNKSIDGGMIIEPFVAQAVAKDIADPWKDPKEYDPDAQVALVVYGKSIIERPEVAEAFMVAYVQSLRDYNDAFFHDVDQDAIVDILVEYSSVKEKTLFVEMFPTGLNPDGYVRMKGVQMDIDWYKSRELLKGDLTAEEVVDNSYVDYALEVLGKYGK
jgi:ABC-type nitrate/sulfonate/bicarbonate transport system substrate-binding protein